MIAFLFYKKLMKWGIMLSTAQDLYVNKKFKKCFLNLIQLSNKMSHDVDYLDLLFKVQMKLNDQSAAIKTLDVLIHKTDSANYLIIKMNLLMSKKLNNEALDIGFKLQTLPLSKNIELQLFQNLTDIYIVFNDFEGVQEVLNQYVQYKTESTYHFAQGLVYIQNDDLHLAIQSLRQAVQINPNFDQAWVTLAIMHNKMGDTELALANIEKALDINEQNPTAVKCYAIWKEQAGDYSSACDKIGNYLDKNNFDQDLTMKNIELFRKLGRNDLAFNEEVKLTYYFGHI